MDKRYKIDLPKGGAVEVETPPDFFRLPFVMSSIAKRMSGKTCSMSNFLQILHRMDRLDRLILVSPTYHNNQHYFAGLPLDPLLDVIEPSVDSAQIVMDKLEEEGKLYDEYIDKMKRWTELMKLVKYPKRTSTTSTNHSENPRDIKIDSEKVIFTTVILRYSRLDFDLIDEPDNFRRSETKIQNMVRQMYNDRSDDNDRSM